MNERNKTLSKGYELLSEYTDTIKSPSMTQKITDKERQQNDQELRNLMTDIDELMVEVGLSGDAKAISCELTVGVKENLHVKEEQNKDRTKNESNGRKYNEEEADIFIVELEQLLDAAETQ